MMVVCASSSPRSSIISTRSRRLSLWRRYHVRTRGSPHDRSADPQTMPLYPSHYSSQYPAPQITLYPMGNSLFAPDPSHLPITRPDGLVARSRPRNPPTRVTKLHPPPRTF